MPGLQEDVQTFSCGSARASACWGPRDGGPPTRDLPRPHGKVQSRLTPRFVTEEEKHWECCNGKGSLLQELRR